ncbi:hypothetical protein GCM10027590_16860 [Nocardiopsis nanhaiensis]
MRVVPAPHGARFLCSEQPNGRRSRYARTGLLTCPVGDTAPQRAPEPGARRGAVRGSGRRSAHPEAPPTPRRRTTRTQAPRDPSHMGGTLYYDSL